MAESAAILSADGVSADEAKEAVRWARRAAIGGHATARRMLAEFYETEFADLEPNPDYTLLLYRAAAQAGDEVANIRVSVAAVRGELGLGPNPEDGLRRLRVMSDADRPPARVALAKLYLDGVHVPKDEQVARHLLGRAAEQDNEEAKRLLETLSPETSPATRTPPN